MGARPGVIKDFFTPRADSWAGKTPTARGGPAKVLWVSLSLSRWPLHMAFPTWQLRPAGLLNASAQGFQEREADRNYIAFYDLVLEILWYHFCRILFIPCESGRPARLPEAGARVPHVLMGGLSKNWGTYFETTTVS